MDTYNPYKEATIRDYINLVYRKKWLILICTAIVFSMSAYYSITRPPVYESVATFMIEKNEAAIPMLEGLHVKESSRPFEFYQAIFNSRLFMNKVVENFMVLAADSLGLNLSDPKRGNSSERIWKYRILSIRTSLKFGPKPTIRTSPR